MPFLEWDESLNLGDAMLDRQHRTLVDLINKVHRVSESPDRDREIMHSITEMFLYAKEHFFAEEGLMIRLGFPEVDLHMDEHKAFVDKARNLTDSCLDGRLDYAGFLNYLVTWLRQHIAVEDARIVHYASTQGLREA